MGALEKLVSHVSSFRSADTETTVNEEECSFSVRSYVKAIGWSVLLSTVVIMESFDVVVTTGFFKLDSFQRTFGDKTLGLSGNYEYEISPSYQSAIVNALLAGEIAGLILCGWIAERLGYRWTLTAALTLLSFFLLVLFLSDSVWMFIAGQFLCGIPLGVFQTLPVNYAQDILPDSLKPYLTTYVNFCWAFGGLLGSAVQRATMHAPNNWSWRLPIALQWIWPVPLIGGILLAPESPVWLVRREQAEKAMRSLTALTPEPCQALETLSRTNTREEEVTSGANYRDCFRKANVRRTEATTMVWAIQIACGSTLMYFSTVFFEEAGLEPDKAYTLTPILYTVGCVGTFVSWFFVARYTRRALYMAGNALMAVILFGMGIAGLFSGMQAAKWAAAILLIGFTLVYDCTVGPVCYCLVAELPSLRLKQKTVPLARCVYLVLAITMNVLVPRMLGPEEWNWGARSGFFFGGGCILAMLWTYFRLPETKGKTGEEVDDVFQRLQA